MHSQHIIFPRAASIAFLFLVGFKGIVNRVLAATIRLCPVAGNSEAFNTAQLLTQQQHTGT